VPVSVVALSNAWVCGRSVAGIVGSTPPGPWMTVSFECCVLSGRGVSRGLVARPKDPYSMWCVWMWLWSLDNGGRWPTRGCCAIEIINKYDFHWGTAVAQWLRCCATTRKVAGAITDGIIGIFHWHNPSDRTMALGSTQSLIEMSTRSVSWG